MAVGVTQRGQEVLGAGGHQGVWRFFLHGGERRQLLVSGTLSRWQHPEEECSRWWPAGHTHRVAGRLVCEAEGAQRRQEVREESSSGWFPGELGSLGGL